MSGTFADVTEDALRLSQVEQLRLARTLLERSEATAPNGANAAWEDEIERRIAIIDAGMATARPFSDVLRDIDRQLGR